MSKSNLMSNLEVALQQEVEAFLDNRLEGGDVVEMFFAKHGQGAEAVPTILEAFEASAPELATANDEKRREVNILAVPPGPYSSQLTSLVQQTLPEAHLATTESTDDIVFYREQPRLALAHLEQVGPTGREAYEEMLTVENCSPHSRIDISEWLLIEPE
jgi:hypothetical protein